MKEDFWNKLLNIGGKNMAKHEDIYEQLTDPDCEMDMYGEVPVTESIKPYLYAFAFTIFVIAPWCVGCGMLIKWIIF